MDKRRLGGFFVFGVVALFVGACAQASKSEVAGAKVGAAEERGATADLVARSADAMSRFWDEEKSGGTRPAADAAPVVRADRNAAPAAGADVAVPMPSADAAGAPVEAPESVTIAVPLPSPSAVFAAPAAPREAAPMAGGIAGFFSAGAVAGSAEALKHQAFRIRVIALCSKVDGFGRFTRLETAKITGRPVPLLVYTQVDGFAYRTLSGDETAPTTDDGKTQWVVDLGQTVSVYRLSEEGKGTDEQVLYVPEQPCRDVAVGKRRDHFLVQRIDLSPWLVAGKYAVKVTLRDKATGLIDERVTELVLR
ncbi:MAG: hypothetical protein Q8L55_12595 [Phycisphaerales bacterium]|nr:hypothetical protein [Phycisphaerales bacterium]